MKEEFLPVYKGFIDKYGIQSQHMMCIEEMSELSKAICKLDRVLGTDKEKDALNNLKEEIADVINMVEQLEYYYGENEIEDIRQFKIKRAKELYFDNWS